MFPTLYSVSLRRFLTRLLLGCLVCLAVIAWDFQHRRQLPLTARAIWPASLPHSFTSLRFQAKGQIPMPANTPAAHASSLLAMPFEAADTVLAFWFAGSKESAPDIGIAASGFDRTKQEWLQARFIVTREALGQSLGYGVRRIGNPVAWLDADRKVHLFVVVTGLGGWAASRIVHLQQVSTTSRSSDLVLKPVRVLPLSWFWNISHLVRSAPLSLEDGGMELPIHFELGMKYPLVLRFDSKGEFMGMVRMSQRPYMLQPTLIKQSEQQWVALMRDQRSDGRITAAKTQDGGQTWHDIPDLALSNPDASIAGLGLMPGYMVLAHNSSPHSRNTLDLSYSVDGQSWTVLQSLAQGTGAQEFSYPALAWAGDSLWVSYTDQRQRISWQNFRLSQ